MGASAMAVWLDSFFAGYDHFFLKILHVLAEKAGGVLTPLMRLISFLGEKGIVFFLLALVFMLMADKRDLGVCIFGAVCCGALITNLILKDAVGRVRPYEAVAEYNQWWRMLGSPAEDDWSFPSGHVTACAAAMTAITLMRGKKWIVPSVVIVFLMGMSRNYLMAHYPSDVLFAVIIGVFSGFVAWIITQAIFRFLNRSRKRIPLCATLLEFDIRDVRQFPVPNLAALKGAGRKAAPSRRGGAAKRAPADEPDDPDDDVKTYSGGRHAVDAPKRSRAVRIEEEEPDVKPAPSRRRAAPVEEDAAPVRRRRSAPVEEEPAPSRRRTAPAEEETEAEAKPRRARSAAASGGRHAIEPAAKESASRSSRLRVPGGYQGKHVK